jgi:putative flavoprotein involved in K+ transport
MPTVQTLVIGAGQAGLAVSRCLTERSVEHVVLERGRLADRWRTNHWESLHLLTPNWASRLPGWSYQGPEPSGFMSAAEVATYLSDYATSFDAPAQEGTPVLSVERADEGGFRIRTPEATWRAAQVVIATGWCAEPHVPRSADRLDPMIGQLTPATYRRPDALADGGVLVVGASASGVQLADELARAGRDVVLAAGGHSRVPRHYRGLDIWSWLERIGTFAVTIDEVADPVRSRDEGSMQLIGRRDGRDVDLRALQALGVELGGRLAEVDGYRVQLAPDLADTTAAADARLGRLLDRIDAHVRAMGLDADVLPAERPPAVVAPQGAPDGLDLRRRGISTVIWATGYTRPYPWLRVPVLDAKGEIAHRRGVTPAHGLYVVGQRFQHRRDSNFLDGVRHDAAFLADHIATSRTSPSQPVTH